MSEADGGGPVSVEPGLGPYRHWDRIDLRGIDVDGVHGVFPHEKTTPQPFVVDLTLLVGTARAATSDDLDDTIDYVLVGRLVADLVRLRSYNLIEALADVIATEVLALPGPQRAVSVTVHKPRAAEAAGAGDVAVTVHRHARGSAS